MMDFCWVTSFLGYPNFLAKEGNALRRANHFRQYVEAAQLDTSYAKAKLSLNVSSHQAETIKAAFQEYGLLFVSPNSDILIITPLGKQVYALCYGPTSDVINQRAVLVALSRGLARYQFANPLPVGVNVNKSVAQSSDVLPYLASYYLLEKLGGIITVSELRGAVFGLQQMADLPMLAKTIAEHRQSGTLFPELLGLPDDSRTANNLKIYFMSHLSLASEVIDTTVANFYGKSEQAFEFTKVGEEIMPLVLDEEWPAWRDESSRPPQSRNYLTVESYFTDGVGQDCPISLLRSELHPDDRISQPQDTAALLASLLTPDDLQDWEHLPKREYEEGRRRLVWHARAERSKPLIDEAKRRFKTLHGGQLFCEACGFNFSQRYGERGEGYIEAHHKVPISQLTGPVRNTVGDLAMVCSNCHRMLHRKPWIKVEELAQLLKTSVVEN